MTAPDGWEGLLDEGEEILWQGAPDGGVHLRLRNLALAAFGSIFTIFSLVWMVGAAAIGGGFWMFGLIHFSVGVALILGAVLWGPFKRRRTFYSLSNRRAFIATQLPLIGRQLKAYPITPQTTLSLKDGALASIHFAVEPRHSKNGTYLAPIGFDRIAEGRHVFDLLRKVQRDSAKNLVAESEKP